MKMPRAICIEAPFSCDFPKMQGEVGPRPKCPRTLMGPLTMTTDGPEPKPEGCLIQTGGTCRDNHAYSAECPSTGVSECTCKIDGAVIKTVTVECSDALTACGFPLQ